MIPQEVSGVARSQVKGNRLNERSQRKCLNKHQRYNSHFLLLWEYRLFQLKLAPFMDQPMEVQLMLSRTPRIVVPHSEQVGTQCSITVKEQN